MEYTLPIPGFPHPSEDGLSEAGEFFSAGLGGLGYSVSEGTARAALPIDLILADSELKMSVLGQNNSR